MNTAVRNATLTSPPPTSVRPSTIDSGMPSSTAPSTMASPDPSCCGPSMRLRSAPPMRSIHQSPAKKVNAPAASPSATPRPPCAVSTASSTRSNATALMSTPAPTAMTMPTRRGLNGSHSPANAPTISAAATERSPREGLTHAPHRTDRATRRVSPATGEASALPGRCAHRDLARHEPRRQEEMAMILADVGFAELFWTAVWIFFLFMFIWVFVILLTDLFRDHSLSGWAKAAWVILLILFPLIGSLIYLIVRGQGMAERSAKEQQAAKAQFDSYVRQAATGTGSTQVDDLARLADLRSSGHISDAEFETMKQRILGGNSGPAEEPSGGTTGPAASAPTA